MLGSYRRDRWRDYRAGRKDATPTEIRSYFRDQHGLLFWVALVITGREDLAKSSTAAACQDSTRRQNVFLDWVDRWAEFATVRSAISTIKAEIAALAVSHEGQSDRDEPWGLTVAEIRVLREMDASFIPATLDPLARSALVLQTLPNTSLYDCVAVLDLPRATVLAARFRALSWLRGQTSGQDLTARPAAQNR